jgi:hypothetical protein
MDGQLDKEMRRLDELRLVKAEDPGESSESFEVR